MANQLDLEEQEQLDQLKHFWAQYGNAISWLLIAVFGVFAAWNGYQMWQRSQATQAAALFDELERVVKGADSAKTQRALDDMKERFASTTYAMQAGLLVAKSQQEAGAGDAARATLGWVAGQSTDSALADIAKLRLSALLIESRAYDEALLALEGVQSPEFEALRADRRGDIYALQGKRDLAKQEYQSAYRAMDERTDYRRLVDIKLAALGAAPAKAEVAAAP